MSAASNLVSKRVFFVSLFFFLALQVYGIYYALLRLQLDASIFAVFDSVFGYHTPVYRYAFILNKFLLHPWLGLHLPMKVFGIVFCINDAIFYLGVAFLTILFAKRYDYAAAILASPVLIHGLFFYLIVNEIFLSGSLLILYTAANKYMEEGIFKKALLVCCMFFIIWSHPIALLCLAVFLPFNYPSFDHVKKAKGMFLFIGVNTIIRLALLSDYDNTKINDLHGHWFEFGYWAHTLSGYFFEFGALTVLSVLALYFIAFSKNKIQYSGLVIIPVLLAFWNSVHSHVATADIVKYFYPVTLFLLMLGIIYICSKPMPFRKIAPVLLALLFVWSFSYRINHYHKLVVRRTELIKNLNLLCIRQQPGHSKWFVKEELLDSLDNSSLDWHTEPLFFSAYENQSPTIQLVRATKSECIQLLNFPIDSIYINKDMFLPINKLYPNFHVTPGPYKELVLDSAKMSFLKMRNNRD